MKKAWIYLFIATILAASGLMADWDPQDGHKMHYPQLPDPKGWDVCLRPMAIADDFMCRQSGPITDIHFWVSWKDDYIRQTPAWDIAIYSDGNGTPGKPLWRFKDGRITLRYEVPSLQGWFCPCYPDAAQKIIPDSHTRYAQVNVTDIRDPFKQEEGTVYWLVIRANMPQLEKGFLQPETGWKTSLDHFRRPAMWVPWPIVSTEAVNWQTVALPDDEQIDMAFVINGKNTTPPEMDFGDAPELYCFTWPCPHYPTTLANDGARHIIKWDVFLGNPNIDYVQIDAETDGQPTVESDGDDTAGFNDEQGVHLPKSITPGTTVSITVWASTEGFLDAWIDFNADGDWDDRGEQIFAGAKLKSGANELQFAVPLTENDANTKQTYSRWRFSTSGGLSYTGLAKDGEVEDYVIRVNQNPNPEFDFGDAPDGDFAPGGYPTLLLNDGARHKINPRIHLGRYIDREPDGQPSIEAEGDDESGNVDDEDGVYFGGPLIRGETAEVNVIASADGFLNAWIDFNGDGDWDDAGEQICTALKIAAGSNGVRFDVPMAPVSTAGIKTYARFRYTTGEADARLGYKGLAEDGEVEDYVVTVEMPQPMFDFGDAPELRCGQPDVVRCNSYPTTLGRDGARHVIRQGVWMGHPYTEVVHIDAEPDGLPSSGADGDDLMGADDEDGVTFVSPLIPGHPAKVEIQVSTDGFIDAWIDFNHDGDWDDFGEQIFASEKVALGTNELEFRVPPHPHAIALDERTYARFRFSTYCGLKYGGPAKDGEVEDYLVKIEPPDRLADLGDAPDSSNSYDVNMTAYPSMGMLPVVVPGRFPTVYRKGSPPYGPVHWVPEIAHLGTRVSQEIEADYGFDQDGGTNLAPSRDAADMDGCDDGVAMPLYLPPCRETRFAYTVNVNRPVEVLYVNVWLDFNRDGDWDDVLMCDLPTAVSDGRRVAREWAVRNQVLTGLRPGLHEIRTPGFVSWHPRWAVGTDAPIWMRITLSDRPWGIRNADDVADALGWGGSGPENGYWTGESEDYFFTPLTDINDLADLNGDLKVDMADLAIMADQWLLEIIVDRD